MNLAHLGLTEVMHPSKENQTQVKIKDEMMRNNIQNVSFSPRSDKRFKKKKNEFLSEFRPTRVCILVKVQ